MKNTIAKQKVNKRRRDRGYTLLEYCAGAAMLLAIVWAGMTVLGDSLSNYLQGIATWLDNTNFQAPR